MEPVDGNVQHGLKWIVLVDMESFEKVVGKQEIALSFPRVLLILEDGKTALSFDKQLIEDIHEEFQRI